MESRYTVLILYCASIACISILHAGKDSRGTQYIHYLQKEHLDYVLKKLNDQDVSYATQVRYIMHDIPLLTSMPKAREWTTYAYKTARAWALERDPTIACEKTTVCDIHGTRSCMLVMRRGINRHIITTQHPHAIHLAYPHYTNACMRCGTRCGNTASYHILPCGHMLCNYAFNTSTQAPSCFAVCKPHMTFRNTKDGHHLICPVCKAEKLGR